MSERRFGSELREIPGLPPIDVETIGVILELAAHDGCRRALDIAAGDGSTALALSAIACQVVAVSASAELEPVARGSEPAVANIAQSLASPFSLPFADASFDLVTCRVAAQHFHRVRPALDEVVRVMAPAAIFVLADALTDREEWIGGAEPSDEPNHATPPHSPASWCRLLEEHGLLVDTTVTTISSPTVDAHPGAQPAAATGSIGDVVQPRVAQTCSAGRDAALRRVHWRGVVIRARKP